MMVNRTSSSEIFGSVSFNESGLVPAIVQSAVSGRVLMMAWMNSESLLQTIESGETVFFSRSRQALWHKGSTSGNTQSVVSIEIDCDADCLLIRVIEAGAACHSGTESCFDTATLYSNQESAE
jgi:phosphoribosyl-AMP cyclohydrolase